MQNVDLLSLPWEIQVALASGYAAYMVAYTGLRDRHRTIDIAFITLVFSLIATAGLALTTTLPALVSGAIAFAAALVVGILWRKWGRDLIRTSLREANVSWSDDDPSALATLASNARCPVSQVAVLLDDDTWLSCNDTSRFNDSPFGPCQIGPNGDVALYLTHEARKGEAEKELKTVVDPQYGHRITYIPANRIRRLTIRHMMPR